MITVHFRYHNAYRPLRLAGAGDTPVLRIQRAALEVESRIPISGTPVRACLRSGVRASR
jgi:hypothetical protein